MATPILTAHITHLAVMGQADHPHAGCDTFAVDLYTVDPVALDLTDVVRDLVTVDPPGIVASLPMLFSSARNRYSAALSQSDDLPADTTVNWRAVGTLCKDNRVTIPDLGGQRAAEARLVQELTGGIADLDGLPDKSIPCIGLVNLTYTRADR